MESAGCESASKDTYAIGKIMHEIVNDEIPALQLVIEPMQVVS
jgi:hypothetical protein